MPQKRIEDDLGTSRRRGSLRVLQAVHLRREREGGAKRGWSHDLARSDRARNGIGPLRAPCLEHPVAALKQLFHRALTHPVELPYREKEVTVQAEIVDLGQREWGFPQPAELLAEHGAIELAIGRRHELCFAADLHG